ncbi:MAG: tRNA pseudouridine(38-40) synthase TruA [Acetobacter malorum]|uniref:tRNA pseudouridine(38-40) synthase TruA n=1 Tax=Acetobacter malorum TaxID=178901 RepID=UPI0009ECCD3A|nr:tRNA pseudouridine(38-40) synthase TruA [Acetobacter malorum]
MTELPSFLSEPSPVFPSDPHKDAQTEQAFQRWAVKIEYDGTGLVGWQKQSVGTSVQGLLEAAATRMANGRRVSSITAGRTDAGVHALGQVAHLDFPADMNLAPHIVRDGLSYHLKPHPVAVLQAALVTEKWSARFSATWRSYLYRIINRPSPAALGATHMWHVRARLNLDKMREGADRLVGTHDFTSFRAAACQARNPVRTLDSLTVERVGEEVHIRTRARSFLHHQVRNMVGTLVLVGRERWAPERITAALEARSRTAGGPTAPAEGLYLTGVGYNPDPFADPPTSY